VQVFYAGLDYLVVIALQVAFGLTDSHNQILPVSHRPIGCGHRLPGSYFLALHSFSRIHIKSHISNDGKNKQYYHRYFQGFYVVFPHLYAFRNNEIKVQLKL
jgi:hypothetical protein